jgi:N-acetylneuraminic acid mutarotase
MLPLLFLLAAPGELPPLPVGVSSLGAAVCDDALYVYGGHAGKTHSYDTASVLGTFHRLPLAGGAWEELPGGPRLQGVTLTAHGGKVYRVGGMTPFNPPGEKADIRSTAACAVFDPKSKAWKDLPPLPAPRSSHDTVVVGDTLLVVGGWASRSGDAPVWHDSAVSLDLSATIPEWKTLPQPFKRRALTATAAGGKVYVIGGLEPDGTAVRRVDVFDPQSRTWAEGPELPGADRVGFSPAATTLAGQVLVNTSAGPVWRLAAGGWEQVGTAARKRMVARLLAAGGQVVLVGGAGGGQNVSLIERITPAPTGTPAGGD